MTRSHKKNTTIGNVKIGRSLNVSSLSGPVHIQSCCPGSVTGVAWYGLARDWCARGSGFDSRGEPLFLRVSLSNEKGKMAKKCLG